MSLTGECQAGRSSTGPAVRLLGVERRFGGVCAVKSVSFDVEYGERRAILGPNGAGKTTLFNLVAGDIRPTAGEIWLFGADVTRVAPHVRARRGLARTYQAAQSFGGLTVGDNLLLALRGRNAGRMSLKRPAPDGAQRERARSLAASVGLARAYDLLAATLSHGEGRVLDLAMALAGQPRVVLLDEPAAGLGPAERAELAELLLALDPSIALLLIEHDMEIALRVADVVTVMSDGAVFATGTPTEMRASRAVHDLYLGVTER